MVFPWLNNNKLIDQQLLKIKEDLVEKMKCNVNQPMPPLQTWEQNIIDSIVNVTNTLNANNVTRTAAYLNFYIRHPDIHWALLGHMVSRNGGWHMTDLKGDLLTRLISEKEQKKLLFIFRTWKLVNLSRCIPAIFTLSPQLAHETKLILPPPLFKRINIYGNNLESLLGKQKLLSTGNRNGHQ